MEVLDKLKKSPRLLLRANLKPAYGVFFQPTGFPDLGAAEFLAPDGTPMLLVESAQSMANRLEAVCWNEKTNDLYPELKGLSYIHVNIDNEGHYTNSILESHRINSEYIISKSDKDGFWGVLKDEMNIDDTKPVDFRKVYSTIFKYDCNSLIHGAFLEELDGRIRFPRILSSYIEALNVKPVQSGGAKISRVQPKRKHGAGNVIFSRTYYTAEEIVAYFNIDLAGLGGFGLEKEAEDLLTLLSLYKIRRFLEEGLRLRTECDFVIDGNISINTPKDIELPELAHLQEEIPFYIKKCSEKELFANPAVTNIDYKE